MMPPCRKEGRFVQAFNTYTAMKLHYLPGIASIKTLGIDLAAQPKKTGMCEIEWSDKSGRLTELMIGATDDDIVEYTGSVDKVGVDVPFGWPIRFIDALLSHSRRTTLERKAPNAVELRWRKTDQNVFDRTSLRPLSVSTDKIGAAALRWARLEIKLRESTGLVVDRTGGGQFVEVYPAAALSIWNLAHSRYKGARNRPALTPLLDHLQRALPDLDLGHHRPLLIHSDDAFDALICSLVARAAHQGLTDGPSRESSEASSVEGWIHLPQPDSLSALIVRK